MWRSTMKTAGLALLVTLAGCVERDARWEAPLTAEETVTVGEALVTRHEGLGALGVLRPDDLSHRLIALGGAPRVMAASPGAEGVLALDDHQAAIWAPLDGPPRRYPVGVDFDRITFSPEGDRAVLSFSPEGGGDQPVISNPNQIAILDLTDEAGPENPQIRTLRAFGGVPTALQIEDRRAVAGAARQLAWALSDRYVTLFDLLDPGAVERTVHLVPEGSVSEVRPSAVLLGEVGGAPMAFVRAEESPSIYALSFAQAPAPGEVPRPSLSLLVSGPRPTDMILADLPEGRRLLTVNAGDDSLSSLAPESGQSVRVSLDHDVTSIRTFPGESQQLALLWAPQGAQVSLVDLDRFERRRGQAVTTLALPGALVKLIPAPALDRALAWVRLATGQDQLVLLDLAEGTVVPLGINGELMDLHLDPISGQGYAAVRSGAVPGGFAVVGVDVLSEVVTATAVPAGPGSLHLVAGDEGPTLVVVHDDLLGKISRLPAAELGSAPFEVYSGFVLEGVTER